MRSIRTLNLLWLLAGWGLLAPNGNAADPAGNEELRFLKNLRQLTYDGRRSGEGYFSPDGKSLVFQSERDASNPFYQIYLLDFESGDIHRVSPGTGKTTCGFFRPRTDELLFASTHLDSAALPKQKAELEFRAAGKQRRYTWDYDEQMDIFSARRDGSSVRRLTTAVGYDAEASYSPDGSKIVFTSTRDAYPSEKLAADDRKRLEQDPSYFAEIYLMNADGSDQRRLTFTAGYDGGPFFSPDGQRIIWRRFDEQGTTADVYTMKLDGSDVQRLTDFGCMSWAPFFHPTGRYAIFTANKLGFDNFELYLVDARGQREPVRVTFTAGFDGLPTFSPDGKKLCWTSNRTAGGNSQLFLADWNHEAALAALEQAPTRKARTTEASGSSAAKTEAAKALVLEANQMNLSEQISQEDLSREVGFLASDKLEGRMTGSLGAHAAAEFIAEQLRRAGLNPMGDPGTFFQEFEFSAGVRVLTNENHLLLLSDFKDHAGQPFAPEKDFRPLAFTSNGDVEGEVVFVGYGLSVPGKAGEGYDSYAGLNVSNKIVLMLRYVPESVEPKRRQELNRYASPRYKAFVARNHGAKAMLIVSGPNSPNPGSLVTLSSDGSLSGSEIVAASIGTNVAVGILNTAGKDLQALQSALDTENPHAEGGFVIPRVKLKLTTAVERIKRKDRNVLAAVWPVDSKTRPEFVLVGAHYDHLGRGEMSTLARKEEEGQIHNGADDNASGVAALLELAADLAATRRRDPAAFRNGVLFGFWSGEELGLIGSAYFAEHPTAQLTNIVAYLNFDMVGRLRDNKLILQGVGSSSSWRRLIEKRNISAGFNLTLQEDPYLPTDATALYPKGLPVLNFFTGSHEDYHRPTDDPATLNYEGLERITKFGRALVLDLTKTDVRPDYVKVERSDTGGRRENLRAYLGTIPDYATEVAGVKLSGVRGGSPADKAGLKGGDLIVEFGGQKIANIYDYTYALDAVKIGQAAAMVVIRDGQRLTVNVTPEARK